jgi:hypothetical protein
MPELEKLKQQLADTRDEVIKLTVMAMRPDLSPERLELIRKMERSARTAAKRRKQQLDLVLKQRSKDQT